MSPKVGVVLSGCGYLDGAEITESVLTLYFLDRAGAEVHCFAPDREQFHVVDHLRGEPTGEVRNVLREAARIARGRVRDLKDARIDELDALVLPGGYGVAKNLSDFAFKGPLAAVDPTLAKLVVAAVERKKPVVAICISPAVVALALRSHGSHAATLTVGNDPGTAAAIQGLGCRHESCGIESMVVDLEHRIISTPAYMPREGAEPTPAKVGAGIEAAIERLMTWLR